MLLGKPLALFRDQAENALGKPLRLERQERRSSAAGRSERDLQFRRNKQPLAQAVGFLLVIGRASPHRSRQSGGLGLNYLPSILDPDLLALGGTLRRYVQDSWPYY